MSYGIVSDIKRFAVHDGVGIRTTVFLKGCSLKCVWCHNPESIGFKPEIAFYKTKCLNCGECAEVCPTGAHKMENGLHKFNRELCVGCGKCEEACLGDAIKFYGKKMTVSELLPLLLEDKSYYEKSGGGVTLSGGECLCQLDFCLELLKALKKEGINTAVDTCGFVPKTALEKVAPFTDTFLYDVKAIDPKVHETCTGYTNELILENIKFIDNLGKKIEVRIPFVPNFNSGEVEKIHVFLKEIKNLTAVKVLAYHNYASSKYDALGLENTLPEITPSAEDVSAAQKMFE